MVDMKKLVPALIEANAGRWKSMKATRDFTSIARSMVAGKDRYLDVSKRTGVPWFVVAVIHEREASQNWHTQLGQGDPLDKVSVHKPAGRGPFKSWEDGAVDALVNCGPYAAKWRDWSPAGTLTLLESYNGIGYALKGRPSPYVWAGTDQYVSGKYVADGKYDPNVVDKQPGCANLIVALQKLDPSVSFGEVKVAPVPPAPTQPIPVPAPGKAPAQPVPVHEQSLIESAVAWFEEAFRAVVNAL